MRKLAKPGPFTDAINVLKEIKKEIVVIKQIKWLILRLDDSGIISVWYEYDFDKFPYDGTNEKVIVEENIEQIIKSFGFPGRNIEIEEG